MAILINTEITQKFRDLIGPLAKYVRYKDSSYFIPSWKWIDEDFHPWFVEHMTKMYGSFKWQEWRDCDDFALGYSFLIRVCYARGERFRPLQSIACSRSFEYWKYREDGSPETKHEAIALFIDHGELIFIEPQGPCRIELSPRELGSIVSVEF